MRPSSHRYCPKHFTARPTSAHPTSPVRRPPPTPGSSSRFRRLQGLGLAGQLIGNVTIDPTTGQVTTEFADDQPQTPFTKFSLTLNGGDHAVLQNPRQCGHYTTTTDMTPWSGGAVTHPSDSFDITNCPSEFFSQVEASADPSTAGANSASHIVITRADGQQLLKQLNLSLPAGAVGSLTAVPLCPLSNAQQGTCGSQSKIGKLTTDVGVGSAILKTTGGVFLAEPSVAGDAATIAIVIPSKVGPIDLGNVIVLNRVQLRKSDGGIDVSSADIPTILGGIPLPVKRISIDVDRDGFFINPTGCEPRMLFASFTSDQNQSANAQAQTQATGCGNLPFKPKLRLIAKAQGQTARFQHTGLQAIVTQAAGEANIAHSRVVLPQVLRPDNVPLLKPGGICQQAQVEQNACPAGSLVGQASAVTPLLPRPLTGPIYVVQYPGRALPTWRCC